GAEVAVAVLPEAAHAIDAGEVFGQRDLDVGVVLVVAQAHVVFGLMVLDVLVLEDQRLDLAAREDELDIGDLGHYRAILGVELVGIHEVLTDTVAHVAGLADVEDLPIGILVEIDAGSMWQRGEDRLEAFGEIGHSVSSGAPLMICYAKQLTALAC